MAHQTMCSTAIKAHREDWANCCISPSKATATTATTTDVLIRRTVFRRRRPDVRHTILPLDGMGSRKDNDLSAYWPKSEIPFGFMTHMNNGGIPQPWFYALVEDVHTAAAPDSLPTLKAIIAKSRQRRGDERVCPRWIPTVSRNQCMFSFWHIKADKLASPLPTTIFTPRAQWSTSAVFCRTLDSATGVLALRALLKGRNGHRHLGKRCSLHVRTDGTRTRCWNLGERARRFVMRDPVGG